MTDIEKAIANTEEMRERFKDDQELFDLLSVLIHKLKAML